MNFYLIAIKVGAVAVQQCIVLASLYIVNTHLWDTSQYLNGTQLVRAHTCYIQTNYMNDCMCYYVQIINALTIGVSVITSIYTLRSRAEHRFSYMIVSSFIVFAMWLATFPIISIVGLDASYHDTPQAKWRNTFIVLSVVQFVASTVSLAIDTKVELDSVPHDRFVPTGRTSHTSATMDEYFNTRSLIVIGQAI